MSGGLDLVLRARRVVLHAGEAPACVAVAGGRIAAVEAWESPPPARRLVELADDEVLLPGLVDTHVHVNEPGRTDWEGFVTATAAAAAGGVTTIIDMPLNSVPPTVDAGALAEKRRAAEGRCAVDVGFWGGAVPGNLERLAGLHAAGVFGFKCFLVPSGVDEFPPLEAADLPAYLGALGRLGALLVAHAEDPAFITAAPAGRAYSGFLASRPPRSEVAAVSMLADAARAAGARVHVVHLSSAAALPAVAAARSEGVPITAETCPHYLTLTAEEVPDGATEYKCCPPIRTAANRDQLWQALGDGVIDMVVSDHSPCPPALKARESGDFAEAWGGIASLQLGLPVVWTEARRRGFSLTDVAGWMAAAPARLAGLDQKGRIAPGCDADVVAFAPDQRFVVDAAGLRQRHPVTPYAGRPLDGVVRRTWLHGEEVLAESPRGRLLVRGRR